MRAAVMIVPLLIATAPAVAAPPQPAPHIPRELADPRMADQLGRVAGTLTRSLMNLPVGEMEAAIEGRPATPADRAKTVRDSVNDPYLEQRITAEAAASGKMMQAATKALVASLPAIMQSLEGAKQEIERATANLPSPVYPKQ